MDPSGILSTARLSPNKPKCSAEIGKISAALAKAQGEFQLVRHDSEVDFVGKKGRTRFAYSSLAACIEAAFVITSRHGIAVVQNAWTEEKKSDQGNKCIHVSTKLCHESGEWMETGTLIYDSATDDPKILGSLITYARRYSLCPALGLSSRDDDDDAGAVSSPNPTGPLSMCKPDLLFINNIFNTHNIDQELRRPFAEKIVKMSVKREVLAIGQAVQLLMKEHIEEKTNAK